MSWSEVKATQREDRSGKTEFFCDDCDVTLYDSQSMGKHLTGKPHLKQRQRIEEERHRRDERGTDNTGRRYYESHSMYADRLAVETERLRRAAEDESRRVSGSPGRRGGAAEDESRRVSGSPGRHGGGAARVFRAPQKPRAEELYCEPCDVYCSSRDIMQSHLSGKKHQKATKAVIRYECKLCLVGVSSAETLQTHYQGTQHMKKVKLQEQERDGGGYLVGEQSMESVEVRDLRRRVQSLDKENSNLRMQVQQLLKFKQNCVDNHGGGVVKREHPSHQEDIGADDGEYKHTPPSSPIASGSSSAAVKQETSGGAVKQETSGGAVKQEASGGAAGSRWSGGSGGKRPKSEGMADRSREDGEIVVELDSD